MRRRDCLIGGGGALGALALQRNSAATAVGNPQEFEFVGLDE